MGIISGSIWGSLFSGLGIILGLGSLRTLYSTSKQAIIAVLIKQIQFILIHVQARGGRGSHHRMYFFAGGVGRGVISGSLQYTTAPEASLYLWGGWGEGKRERAGHDGKGKERREAPAFSLFPSFPAHFLFFRLLLIL